MPPVLMESSLGVSAGMYVGNYSCFARFLEIGWTPFPSVMVPRDQPTCWGILTYRPPHSVLENLGVAMGMCGDYALDHNGGGSNPKNALPRPVTHWRGIIVSYSAYLVSIDAV